MIISPEDYTALGLIVFRLFFIDTAGDLVGEYQLNDEMAIRGVGYVGHLALASDLIGSCLCLVRGVEVFYMVHEARLSPSLMTRIRACTLCARKWH